MRVATVILLFGLSCPHLAVAKCEGEFLARTYRAVVKNTGLVRFLLLNPRAWILARQLGVSPRDIDQPFHLEAVYQFTGRLGTEMNRTARSPFRMLKRMARGRPGVQAYIDELRARAKAAGVQSEWFGPGIRESGRRSKNRVYLNPVFFVQPFALTRCLAILTHELDHLPSVRPRRIHADESLEDFTERMVLSHAVEELRVRRMDRLTRQRLRQIGLRYPPSATNPLTLAIWSADDDGASETTMINMVRGLGEAYVREHATLWWERDGAPP